MLANPLKRIYYIFSTFLLLNLEVWILVYVCKIEISPQIVHEKFLIFGLEIGLRARKPCLA